MATPSCSDTMPWRTSMTQCAMEPAMSWRNSRWSKPMEALISAMMAAGPAEKRPPQSWLAAGAAALPPLAAAFLRGRRAGAVAAL